LSGWKNFGDVIEIGRASQRRICEVERRNSEGAISLGSPLGYRKPFRVADDNADLHGSGL